MGDDGMVMEVELASPIRARLSRAVALQEEKLERTSVEFGEGGSSAAKAAVAEASAAESLVRVAAAADGGGGGGIGTRSSSWRSGSKLGSKTVSTMSAQNSMDEDVEL